jgi:hypothetical protein
VGATRGCTTRHRSLLAVLATFPLLLGALTVGPASADSGQAGLSTLSKPSAPSPSVVGPVTGGKGAAVLVGTSFPLGQVGYKQSEFFLSGTATAYKPVRPLDSDGRWSVAVARPKATYTTRIVVDRPKDARRFNGTVVVEWLNVSAGIDVAPDWIGGHNELIRDGFAWVGVSAQAVGLNATRAADPVRYKALSNPHPGDSFSYDMFSQAGQAVRDSAAKVFGGLVPRRVLADGESQSAFRLTTYIDAVQPLVQVFDGFLVHSRSASGAPLSQRPEARDVPVPNVVRVRTDLSAPVLTLETETDLLRLGYLAARQNDSSSFRLWEIAGTAHADSYFLGIGESDTGDGSGGINAFNSMLTPPSFCTTPINAGEQHYVLDAATHALNDWVTSQQAPPEAPRLVVHPGPQPSFVLDSNGNVEGGVRTPAVDVPVATLSGLGQTGSSFCFLFGTTVPFSHSKLKDLYPTHSRFVRKWTRDTRRNARAGFILPHDADELIAAALVSNVGG